MLNLKITVLEVRTTIKGIELGAMVKHVVGVLAFLSMSRTCVDGSVLFRKPALHVDLIYFLVGLSVTLISFQSFLKIEQIYILVECFFINYPLLFVKIKKEISRLITFDQYPNYISR